jgi:hypothetical protein
MRSTLVPNTTPSSISAETGLIDVQPPTNNTPEITVKRTINRAYVFVPAAPYRLPVQGSHSHRRSQANSTSALLVTGDEIQPTVKRPEHKMPPLQVDGKVPKARTIASTPSLSDIGISIPTTVRKPGSFILHAPHVITQSIEHPEKFVNPTCKSTVGNPVRVQTLRFSKLKKPTTSSSSKNTLIVANTDTQGGVKSPNLPQSQPTPPMPLPEVSNAITEITLQSIADRVHKLLVSVIISIYSFNDG